MKLFFVAVALFLISLVYVSCDFEEVFKKVEVNYDVGFHPDEWAEATITYYDAKGELVSEVIEPGDWSFKKLFNDGDHAGVWIETDAPKGYVDAVLVIWYSELSDLEDYVDANTWVLPLSGKVCLESKVSKEKCYAINYEVVVEGTNGVPVEITYSIKEQLQRNETLTDGKWDYENCFTSSDYASVFVNSVATSGTATLKLIIDYTDKDDVVEVMIIDFNTSTKTGGIGKPIE